MVGWVARVVSDVFGIDSDSGSLDKRTNDGNTALHLCAQLNKTECMKLMLRTRPDLANIENKAGKTPLELAREAGNQLCAELVSVWVQFNFEANDKQAYSNRMFLAFYGIPCFKFGYLT